MAEVKPVIAEKDLVLTDARGLSVQIVAGTEVPRPYLDAYDEATGKRGKAQRAPDTDKAQRGPQTSKS